MVRVNFYYQAILDALLCLTSNRPKDSVTMAFKLSIYILGLSFMLACSSASNNSLLSQADTAFKNEQYSEAEKLYREHMQVRLENESKPEDENPYFYFILIGDSQLKLGQVKEADESYKTAKEKGVFPQLVADRFRLLARFLFSQKKYDEAFLVLDTHRDLDQLAFDGLKDELHKKLISEEDNIEQKKP